MIISPRFGRPYGGRCWFVRNSIEVISCDFINESISILIFKKNNKLFCVIGVYLPYDDNKQHSFSEYSSLLCFIREFVRDKIKEGYTIFIGGDFNADVNRGNRFDLLLSEFS
jgi:exonuclease III